MMYDFYLVLHFILMIVWVVTALVLDYQFLRNFRKASQGEKVRLLKRIRSVSDKLEMPASSFLPMLGILMLIERTFWLKVGLMHGKILVAVMAVGVYHMARGNARKIADELEAGRSVESLTKRYVTLRMSVLFLLAVTVGLIIAYKGTVSTLFLIRSLFNQ